MATPTRNLRHLTGQSQKPQADFEEEITMKVNTQIEGMMQNLSNIIKNIIKEEIKNETQKGIEVPSQRTEATDLEPSTYLDEGCEENVGFRKVQRRIRRTGRSREDNMRLNSAGSSTDTNQSAGENHNIVGTESQQRARPQRSL